MHSSPASPSESDDEASLSEDAVQRPVPPPRRMVRRGEWGHVPPELVIVLECISLHLIYLHPILKTLIVLESSQHSHFDEILHYLKPMSHN